MKKDKNITIFQLAKDMQDKTIDGFEMAPCMEIDKHDTVEQCSKEEAQFWSVYVHYEGGGCDCIADCETEKMANDLMELLTQLTLRFKK